MRLDLVDAPSSVPLANVAKRQPKRIASLALAVLLAVAAVGATVVQTQRGSGRAAEATSPGDTAKLIEQALTSTSPVIPDGMPTGRPKDLGKPFDPPTEAEFGYALGLAVAKQSTAGLRVDGSAGYEFLSVAVPSDVEPGARELQILSFDYEANELVAQKVDLVAGTVEEQRGTGLPAPPSDRESLFAMDLLIKSPQAGDVRAAFKRLTGDDLASPAQLRYTGTSNVPGGASVVAPKCETNRCVTFQGRAHDGAWLYLNQLIVDLSDKTVYSIS